MHYLFFSKAWELNVWWHISPAPDDWLKFHLGRRYAQTEYSVGYQVKSKSAGDLPEPMVPEISLDR